MIVRVCVEYIGTRIFLNLFVFVSECVSGGSLKEQLRNLFYVFVAGVLEDKNVSSE